MTPAESETVMNPMIQNHGRSAHFGAHPCPSAVRFFIRFIRVYPRFNFRFVFIRRSLFTIAVHPRLDLVYHLFKRSVRGLAVGDDGFFRLFQLVPV